MKVIHPGINKRGGGELRPRVSRGLQAANGIEPCGTFSLVNPQD